MSQVKCTECDWIGDFTDLLDESQEDSEGDMSGNAMACPECHGYTEDLDQPES